jgi:hypothetical protein
LARRWKGFPLDNQIREAMSIRPKGRETGLSRNPGQKPNEINTDEQVAVTQRIQADPSESLQMTAVVLGLPYSRVRRVWHGAAHQFCTYIPI